MNHSRNYVKCIKTGHFRPFLKIFSPVRTLQNVIFKIKLTIFLKFNPRSLISPSKVSFDIRVIKFFDKFKTSKYSIGLLTISKIIFREIFREFFSKKLPLLPFFIIIQFEREGLEIRNRRDL